MHDKGDLRRGALLLVCFGLAACGGGGGANSGGDAGSGTATIGAGGGTVTLSGGPTLNVPAGALSSEVTLTIARSSSPAPQGATSALYEFGPAGTVFSQDVVVSFPAPSNGSANVAVYWTKAGSTSAYDVLPGAVGEGTVTAKVRHFSAGFVGAPCTEGEQCTPDASCHVGARQCSSGVPICRDTGVNAPELTVCASGYCNAGACMAGHAISGSISGDLADGVSVRLTGPVQRTVTTAGRGVYAFSNLPDGSYTVAASAAGYTFTPVEMAVTLSGSDQAGRNFTAARTLLEWDVGSWDQACWND